MGNFCTATEEQAQHFNANHRAVLPAIYNANLARYDWNAPAPIPSERVAVNVKLEEENTQLKETIMHLQNQIGAEDLTMDEMQDIQETLMDDDDGLEWAERTLPMPIGHIKSEPIAATSDASTIDIYEEAEDHGIPPNASNGDNEISSNEHPNMFDDSSIESGAGSSNGIADTSNEHANTLNGPTVDTTAPQDAVCGSIEFVLDVS